MKKQKKTSHIAMPKKYSDCKGAYALQFVWIDLLYQCERSDLRQYVRF